MSEPAVQVAPFLFPLLGLGSNPPGPGGGIPDVPDLELYARRLNEWVRLTSIGLVLNLPEAVTVKTLGVGGDFADYAEVALWAQQHIGQALALTLLSDIPATASPNYAFPSFGSIAIQSNGFSSPAGAYNSGSLILLDPFRVTGPEMLQLNNLVIYSDDPAPVVIERLDSAEDVQLFNPQIMEGMTVTVSGTQRTQVFNGNIGGYTGGITTSGHLWLESSITGNATADDASLHHGARIRLDWLPTAANSPTINMGNGSSVGAFNCSLMPGSVPVFATWAGFVSVGAVSNSAGKYDSLLPAPYVPNQLSPVGVFSVGSYPMP